MESPVVVDKPPEYGNADNERGFPFEEDEGAWSQLAARHPDIAARLRQQRPQGWARKRRPSAQGAPEDFPEEFSGFERFPFDDIPPEFRGHFPSHWNRRFGPEEQQQQQQQAQPPPQQQSQSPPPAAQAAPNPAPAPPQRATIATQTEPEPAASPPPPPPPPARAMSAPPDPDPHAPHDHSTNVRHIPIFVEGRDEPVINRNQNANFAESKPAYASPPHADREQYFPDEGFHHPPNFSRTFGAPFKQGFRQGPQPFAQQKVFPQAAAFGRANSPHRSQSPRQEEFVNVPVHHERASPSPSGAQQQKQPQQQPSHQQQQQQYQQQQQQKFQQQQQAPPPQQPAGPKPPPPNANDPITQILAIQTDVLNLMTEVENFKGTKKDKGYLFLDEMLTRNLIKLDNIETDGKENIRQARKEAIKCIQKCISVLESKAEKNANPQPDVDMDNGQQKGENGEVEMTENAKEENAEPQAASTEKDTAKNEEPETADTRPADSTETKNEEQPANKDKKTKKKVVKKRDKSKDKKEGAKDSDSVTDSNKADSNKKVEDMQVDDKGEKLDNSQNHAMEVDGAAASQ